MSQIPQKTITLLTNWFGAFLEKQAEEQEKGKTTEGGGLLDDDAWEDVEDVSIKLTKFSSNFVFWFYSQWQK